MNRLVEPKIEMQSLRRIELSENKCSSPFVDRRMEPNLHIKKEISEGVTYKSYLIARQGESISRTKNKRIAIEIGGIKISVTYHQLIDLANSEIKKNELLAC